VLSNNSTVQANRTDKFCVNKKTQNDLKVVLAKNTKRNVHFEVYEVLEQSTENIYVEKSRSCVRMHD